MSQAFRNVFAFIVRGQAPEVRRHLLYLFLFLLLFFFFRLGVYGSPYNSLWESYEIWYTDRGQSEKSS